METATVTEVKNGLSAILDRVRAGSAVLVTDRGIPVAVIEPVTGLAGLDERLLGLERAGIVVSGRGEPPVDLLRTPPPSLPGGSLVDELLDERSGGW
jgi:prevent-host-death family protein